MPVAGSVVGYLGVSERSIWAATVDGLARIDPRTLKVKLIDHGGHFGIAVTRNAVWTTDADRGTVNRFDPLKGTQTAMVEIIRGYPESLGILGTRSGSRSISALRHPPPGTIGEGHRARRGRSRG